MKPAIHRARREELLRAVPGPVLLVGNGPRPRNFPANHLPFRQDSNFLYFTGCTVPGAAALLDRDGCRIFAPLPAPGDELWHGPAPSPREQALALGVEAVIDGSELEAACRAAGRPLATLAVADPERCRLASRLAGIPLRYGELPGTPELVDAAIHMRRRKSPEELAEHRAAVAATAAAHRCAMRATRPGASEQQLAAIFDAAIRGAGCVPGFDTILTVHGEILHNPHHSHSLEPGRLLLVDGGAERPSGYGADVTRTWPVSGRFDPRQRSACQAVLEAERRAIAACRPGTRYRDVHLVAAGVLATWLADEGLLRCTPQEAVETGAHALFFPHGVGHLLGLDVHDLEQFGDRAAYAPGRDRSSQFGLSYLRLDIDLEPGHLVTIEPGFYVVPRILAEPSLRRLHRHRVDWDRARSWLGFGGIRIEDDVLVTAGEPEVLSGSIPVTIDQLEAEVATGLDAATRLAP